jgi:hypothetical protein
MIDDTLTYGAAMLSGDVALEVLAIVLDRTGFRALRSLYQNEQKFI